MSERLCTRCGQEPAMGTGQRCLSCTNYGRLAEFHRRKQRIEDGLCTTCPKKAEPGFRQCKKCIRKAREAYRKRTGSRRRNRGARSYRLDEDHTGRNRRSFAKTDD